MIDVYIYLVVENRKGERKWKEKDKERILLLRYY